MERARQPRVEAVARSRARLLGRAPRRHAMAATSLLRRGGGTGATLLALLACGALAAQAVPADVPPDVAARWRRLDPKKWSLEQLSSALPLLELPDGFDVDLYHSGSLLDNARSLALSGASRHPGGPVIAYVSTKLANRTYALVDADGDGRAERATTVVDGVDTPQGMDWFGGDLYVSGWRGGKGMIWRLPNIDSYALRGEPFPFNSAAQVVTSRLPADRWHGERYMRFGPDGLLYVTIGAPCDACPERTSPEGIVHASVYTLNVSQGDSSLQLYARGLRNVVGLDFHPDRPTELFMTDNGRDKLGDDQPDCTLKRSDARGLFFGFPFCHTRGTGDPYLRNLGRGWPLPDPKLNAGGATLNCSLGSAYRRPVQALGPHVAPLGMRFYRWENGRSWPRDEYDRAAIIAEHGSWDRSSRIGYRLTLVRLNYTGKGGGAPQVAAYKSFVSGWVSGRPGDPKDSQVAWGRPADVLQLPDGSLLVSDDTAHTVYRIRYTGRPRAPPPPLPSTNTGADAKRWARAAPLATLLVLVTAVIAGI